jgi:hypothetical protein
MFAIPCVKAVDGDEGAANVFNGCLLRLMARRKHLIAAEGDGEKSMIAWKLAAFQQAVLYRVVMLAQGSSNGWNDCNILSSILCARALLETIAATHYVEVNLARYVEKKDFKAMSLLVDGQAYATRNEEWLKDEAGLKAVNVLTAIDKLDGLIPGIRRHYDFLSEWCHPNYLGQRFLFATIDPNKRTVAFSESKNRNKQMLDAILAAAMMIEYFEKLLIKLDEVTPTIARTV